MLLSVKQEILEKGAKNTGGDEYTELKKDKELNHKGSQGMV